MAQTDDREQFTNHLLTLPRSKKERWGINGEGFYYSLLRCACVSLDRQTEQCNALMGAKMRVYNRLLHPPLLSLFPASQNRT